MHSRSKHILTIIVCAGLTACGGGGGSDNNTASVGTAGTTVPVAIKQTGDSAGFPVHAAFAALHRKGFTWTFDLYSKGGVNKSTTIKRTPVQASTDGTFTSQYSFTTWTSGDGGFGNFISLGPTSSGSNTILFNSDLYYIGAKWSSGQCSTNGIASEPAYLTGTGPAATGDENSIECHKSNGDWVASSKSTYRSSINTDGTLNFIETTKDYDITGRETGVINERTYKITRDGLVTPISWYLTEVTSSETLEFFGLATSY